MSIFKRKDRKSYHSKIDGTFVRLGPDRKQAQARWAELVADDSGPCSVTVRTLLKSYFEWLKNNRAESTWPRREYVFKLFSKGIRQAKGQSDQTDPRDAVGRTTIGATGHSVDHLSIDECPIEPSAAVGDESIVSLRQACNS